MSGAYIVSSVNKNAEVECCEAYVSRDLALKRAMQLAELFVSWGNQNKDPIEELLSNGTVRMTVLDTGTHWIGVHFDNVRAQLNISADPSSQRNTLGGNYPEPPTTGFIKYGDKVEVSLPGGWTTAGDPITELELQGFPYDAKPTSELTENQRWALAEARVRKYNPNIIIQVHVGYGSLVELSALDALPELEDRTSFGRLIMEQECQGLDEMREDAMADEDSEDESSEEDYEDDSWA